MVNDGHCLLEPVVTQQPRLPTVGPGTVLSCISSFHSCFSLSGFVCLFKALLIVTAVGKFVCCVLLDYGPAEFGAVCYFYEFLSLGNQLSILGEGILGYLDSRGG